MNLTKEEVQQVLNALQYHVIQTRPIHSTDLAIELLQSKLAECPHGVDDGACKECYNVHTDHPMRHYDRMCPACQKDDVEPVALPDEWPDYHAEAMGCGLEDRCITNRYEAMQYGWDQALEHVAERLPEKLYTKEKNV